MSGLRFTGKRNDTGLLYMRVVLFRIMSVMIVDRSLEKKTPLNNSSHYVTFIDSRIFYIFKV